MTVRVKYQNQSCNRMKLYVVDGVGPALFGRQWLQKFVLDWKELGNNQKAELNSVQPSPASFNDSDRLYSLLDKYQDVFNENQIGKMEGITAKIYMKDDAKPKFVKVRPVPYSLQNKVNDELARLESEGIITRVSHSEWASPIVPVLKSDNTV